MDWWGAMIAVVAPNALDHALNLSAHLEPFAAVNPIAIKGSVIFTLFRRWATDTVGCGDAAGTDKIAAGLYSVTNADEMPHAIVGAGVVAFVARAARIESPQPAANRATPATPRTSSRLIGGAPKSVALLDVRDLDS
jgi:hypothetical protein